MRLNTKRRILSLLNFDDMYAMNRDDAIVLNTIDFSEPGYSKRLSENVFSRSSDLDFIARCECEHLQGNYYIGDICPKCKTEVTLDMEAASGHLRHRAWISCPKEIHGWLNPVVYMMLTRWLSYGKRIRTTNTNARGEVTNKGKKRHGNYIDDILDVTSPILPELEGIVTGKGFNYFFENFDYLMDYFLYHHKQTANKKSRDLIAYMLRDNRHKLFCRYLPILASALHPIVMSEGTSDNRRRYVDKNCQWVLSAAETLSYLEYSPRRNKKPKEIESATYSAYQNHMAYVFDISSKQLSQKRSLPRMHIFGSRLHLSFRGVIVPIIGPHEMDEIQIPWMIAVNLLKLHLIGRLMRRYGMTMGQAYNRQQAALQKFDPLINQLMNEFIAECPYKGLPCILNRNPSIRAGSLQLLFITSIKTDPHDETISVSSLILPLPNGDYDGDRKKHENYALRTCIPVH